MHRKFEELYGLAYIPGQWFVYSWRGVTRYCQTDGLLLLEERKVLLLIEVKYSHTSDAYWQVENLYVPVLRKFMKDSSWQIATVEVVKWYDPAVAYPRKPVLREDLQQVKVGEFAVHIFNRDRD